MRSAIPEKEFDATPRASVLIESMRDLGYTLETALADIVDNRAGPHSLDSFAA